MWEAEVNPEYLNFPPQAIFEQLTLAVFHLFIYLFILSNAKAMKTFLNVMV